MSQARVAKPLFKSSYRLYSLLLVTLPILTLLTVASNQRSMASEPLKAQPILLEYANKTPDVQLSVIVQKLGSSREAEENISNLGGRVTQDLHIINSFTAQIPAQSIPKIAQLPSVRWVSLDAPVSKSDTQVEWDDIEPINKYVKSIRADKVWDDYRGTGVGVAILDSGVNPSQDFLRPFSAQNRLVASVAFNSDANKTVFDGDGHGTHLAGVVAGSGRFTSSDDEDAYVGVAPDANIINVKVANDDGSIQGSSLIAGLQWILENKQRYNIRVVNISLNSTVPESYNVNPLCAAVEVLWFNGIVVVVSAGNYGSSNLHPPANDPFVITVGAVDDKGTTDPLDDIMPGYSAYGMTVDGFFKPEIVAPGKNIVSVAAPGGRLARNHPAHLVDANSYFRMSGTSTSAPMVSGAVALLMQAEPNLSPDQVKFRLMSTAKPFDNKLKTGAGYLNVERAIKSKSTLGLANKGITPSRLISGAQPAPIGSSVSWTSVSWTSVSWTSVSWTSVSWTSTYWGN